MRQLYITIIIMMVFVVCTGCANDGGGITVDMDANTVMSNYDKVWLVTEKGGLYTRESIWDDDAQVEENIVISKIIDDGSGICSLSSPNRFSDFVFAIKADGTLWEVVEDSGQYRLDKVDGIEGCVKACTGDGHILALTRGGSVYAWGDNKYGQLGDGTFKDREAPRKVRKLPRIIDISSGRYHCMALGSDGNVYTWGCNFEGQIGDGTYVDELEDSGRNSVYQVESLSDIVQISAGSDWCVALREGGSVFEWGSRASANFLCLPSPSKVNLPKGIVQISAYGIHALAFSSSGELWGLGNIIAVPSDGMQFPRRIADLPEGSKIFAGWKDIVITGDNEIWQGFIAKVYETDSVPYYSGKFVCIFSNEDVENYGIKIDGEILE